MKEKRKYKSRTFSSTGEVDYITINYENNIVVYKDGRLFLDYDTKNVNINGAVYNGDSLFYTKKKDNAIYI